MQSKWVKSEIPPIWNEYIEQLDALKERYRIKTYLSHYEEYGSIRINYDVSLECEGERYSLVADEYGHVTKCEKLHHLRDEEKIALTKERLKHCEESVKQQTKQIEEYNKLLKELEG